VTFTRLPDLAARGLGGAVVYATDDFFADRANLIADGPARERTEFGPRGKVYNGWESRRRRDPDRKEVPDHAIVRLWGPGVIAGAVVDTAFFRGNYPPFVSVEATAVEGYPSTVELAEAAWETLVPRTAAQGDTANAYEVTDPRRWTHVRLSIHPDGGVARFRVHGTVVPDPRLLTGTIDLAALENGGSIVDCSNLFYATPANLLRPGPARSMGEGWETARRRTPGNDWVVVRLAGAGVPREIEVDTLHFVGNAPAAARVRGRAAGGDWADLLPQTRLQPDTRHRFRAAPAVAVDEVRVDIYPDGGLSRLRVRGELTEAGLAAALDRWWAALPAGHRAQIGTGPPAVAP
jgi:allantoicase